MEHLGQIPESFAQAQREESAGDDIAPLPIRSQLFQRRTAGVGDTEWLTFNLLSLGTSISFQSTNLNWFLCLIDGGGIRGYWTLLALQLLFHYIGDAEEREGSYHSFDPQVYPENVSLAPLTPEEERAIQAVYDPELRLRNNPRIRRYLPCHYFDHICGSSTGA